jgi:hypothetical protein
MKQPSLQTSSAPQIPSDTVPFNEKPDMKAREICEAGKEALRSGERHLYSSRCTKSRQQQAQPVPVRTAGCWQRQLCLWFNQ